MKFVKLRNSILCFTALRQNIFLQSNFLAIQEKKTMRKEDDSRIQVEPEPEAVKTEPACNCCHIPRCLSHLTRKQWWIIGIVWLALKVLLLIGLIVFFVYFRIEKFEWSQLVFPRLLLYFVCRLYSIRDHIWISKILL